MRIRALIVAIICGAAVALHAGQDGAAKAALEAARKTAVFDGDLAAAIKQYQSVVDRFGRTDRPAAAEAELRMGEAQEAQGRRVEAAATYRRVLAEFPGQSTFTSTA